jgi:membrane protease YdiL (CAAX protease family)
MSTLFVIIVVAGLPFLSAVSYKNLKQLESANEELHLNKTPLYLQSVALQIALCLLAFFTARAEKLPVSIGSNFTFLSVSIAVAFTAVALLLAYFSQKYSNQKQESTLHHLLPETWKDRILWILACLIAAFCEEYIYRGVLFQIVQLLTGNSWIISAVICSVVFAFGHGTQGEKAILQIIPFAIGFHLIVYVSNGLLLAMIAHFVYNVLVDLLFGKKIREGH